MSDSRIVCGIKTRRTIGVRCYDNGGETFDRYTVTFTGRYRHTTGGEQFMRGMSEHPCHPQGFGIGNTYSRDIDRPSYKHLGKRIPFDKLPPDCQSLAISDAFDLACD